jgi:hypothetical protein
MNPELVTNIQMRNTPILMQTNAGTKKIVLEATVPGFGSMWFDPNQIANIYGFSHMVDEQRITYDSDKEGAFLVHSDDGTIKFKRTLDGLYAYRPTAKFKKGMAATKGAILPINFGRKQTSNMITTVKEDKMGYTQRQFESAKRAQ